MSWIWKIVQGRLVYSYPGGFLGAKIDSIQHDYMIQQALSPLFVSATSIHGIISTAPQPFLTIFQPPPSALPPTCENLYKTSNLKRI
jgi:hypothetical protein